MIEVQQLVFEYPGKRVLHQLSFHLEPSTITALVGPNGAGKTTLLRLLAALEEPFSGAVTINGLNQLEDGARNVHRLVGYLSDFFGLYNQLSVHQCLSYAGMAHGLSGKTLAESIHSTAQILELNEQLAELAGNLSRGWRQRVAIGQAIIHRPKVLLLDEPASGLDPEARMLLAKMLTILKDQGMTVIISSHILAELESYSTHMLTLRDGRVHDFHHISGQQQEYVTLRVELVGAITTSEKLLADIPGISMLEVINEKTLRFRFAGDKIKQHHLLKTLMEQQISIYSFAEEKQSMQDIYLSQAVKPSHEEHSI